MNSTDVTSEVLAIEPLLITLAEDMRDLTVKHFKTKDLSENRDEYYDQVRSTFYPRFDAIFSRAGEGIDVSNELKELAISIPLVRNENLPEISFELGRKYQSGEFEYDVALYIDVFNELLDYIEERL